MAELFTNILVKGIREGQIPAREKSAREWFRKEARKTSTTALSVLKSDERSRFVNNPTFGSMYLFQYDAKLKKTLPFWDRFPLVFPINQAKGGFLGINFHYLPFNLRAKLMDQLYTIANNDKFDKTTKLKISYDVLNSNAKFKEFRPTVKHYLRSQLKSRFFFIHPSEWDIGLFLPIAKFEGASQTTVWKESRKQI